MTHNELVTEAAANLAGWHDSHLKALGVRTEADPVLWRGTQESPVLFFDAVTLGGPGEADDQMEALKAWIASREGETLSVCDSWGMLDLAPLGFEVMRRGQWMVRMPAEPNRSPFPQGFSIERVVIERQMVAWEAASAKGFESKEAPQAGEWHPAKVLEDPRMQVFAGKEDGEVVAGAMAYLSERGVCGVYGVSVVPGHRRKGYAEQLTWRCVLARPHVPASLQPSESAHPLYRKMGFEDAGEYVVWFRK